MTNTTPTSLANRDGISRTWDTTDKDGRTLRNEETSPERREANDAWARKRITLGRVAAANGKDADAIQWILTAALAHADRPHWSAPAGESRVQWNRYSASICDAVKLAYISIALPCQLRLAYKAQKRNGKRCDTTAKHLAATLELMEWIGEHGLFSDDYGIDGLNQSIRGMAGMTATEASAEWLKKQHAVAEFWGH